MIKQKLIVDFDGVIVNSIKSYCKTYNNKYKNHPQFKVADYTKLQQWDCQDECPLEKQAEVIFSNKDFFNNLEFMPNAKEIIEKLSKEYHIIICSIGTPENISYKSLWIKENLPCIKDTILISNQECFMDKSIVNMKDCIFVDDNANNLNSSNADIRICFGKEYSYNKDWDGTKAYNWKNLYKLVHQLQNNLIYENINNGINLHSLRSYYENKLHKGE
ncbi:5' nucleotidase, NT5C type [Clostridium botulinum]|uniref:5' nucleotidase, NT5C type n=1 Tax=Clostridium botulinum TaxID=1491 RepID=UPI001C9B14BE|nr:hypothetical protein [Clostridium botulinum]MBY6842678.1 hypothetical protein [Clostridium botulinum]